MIDKTNFLDAATLIETEGWEKHAEGRSGDGYCAAGALAQVIDGDAGEMYNASPTLKEHFLVLYSYIADIMGAGADAINRWITNTEEPEYPVHAWNDRSSTTKEDVLTLLRKAGGE